ncbi:chromosome segregation protein SMC [Pediococcus pentosaceus]|uniref:chromosome segregation protein SMC n=1 Tax=Pediococcus pentosaceus TaxID=1255 RepID=UPI0018A17D66|nr:chromosome segregation protein SMC [Pediococcus pentosaceus]MBF7123029.1 chromosome segregation protein SMC [Pediococcus pentosaceus]MCR1860595.1 chromosome segregation protein SMC [Pediococcus pentosaceus]
MKLRTIEISGFKSFADNTKIEFKDGITGIVGPNGSGKSNIIEAIRWVMGETSAKSLRGGKMPDVIFSGTEKRKPLSRASVTIIFDNSDHFLDSKFDEVMISRRLFRNGESQYELNRQECRLKDILNLFIDTGLGRESFSVISQGRVESIFNSKPEDRRAIIEEAAGVLEYKQDKKRAENELEKTSGYLERVNDLIVELEKQVQPLEEQAAVAKDYVQQKRRFDILDQTKLVRTINSNSEAQKQLAVQRQEQKEQLTQLQIKSEALADQREKIKKAINEQNHQKDQLQIKLVKLNRLEQQLEGEHDLRVERQKYVDQEKERLVSEQQVLKKQLVEKQAALEDAQGQLAAVQQKLTNTKQSLKVLESDHLEQQKEALKREIEDLRAEYVDQLQALTSLKNQYNFNQQDRERDQQQRQKIQLTVDTLNEQIKQRKTECENLEHQLLILKDANNVQQERITKLIKQRDRLQAQYERERQQWLDGSNVAHRAESKLEALLNLKNEYTGFYQGVRAVLQQKAQFRGIVGPVSEVMNVPAEYTVAIETALGNQVQNVVVDTDQTAKSIIEYLKKNRLGRVTFLPKNALSQRSIREDTLQKVKKMPGFVGVAADLVKVKDDNQVISQYLLGTTLIADTLQNALIISKQISRHSRIITLAGDVIGIGGTMTGGATKGNRTGVLQQDQELKKLQVQVTAMKTKLASKETEVQKILEQGQAVQAELKQALEEQHQAEQKSSELSNQVSLENDRLTELQRRLKATRFELSQIDDNENQQNDLPAQIANLQQEVQQIKENTTAKQDELALLDDDVDERKNRISELRIELARLKEQTSQHQHEVNTLQTTIKDVLERNDEIKIKIQQLDEELIPENDLKHLDIDDIRNRLAEQNQLSAQLQNNFEQNQVQQDRIIADYEITQRQLHQAESQLKEIEGSLTLVQSRIEMAIDKLTQEYEQTFESVQNVIIQNVEDESLERELKLLRRGLNELGTVNLGAIEEYDRVSTRYNFLRDQKNDLADSKAQLEQSIAEIDQEAGQRFKQTFDQVAEEFSSVFVKMFGGGKAELELTDPDNLLTTGIEIKAQPPGKKLQRLSLLSGGEKSLTAITLLFAILQVKPVPFCILDEVEAAFDDANVERFAKYLKNFQGTTQFIVITHRKGTMMEADVLYGVTMQESGVSKMVSVSMDEAE